MATGRIGVTPTLGTRWSKAPAGGTTSLSGLDDNSVALVYSVGYEQVYRNGVLLSRGNDYTATTGNSITLIDATIAGDIIEVFANELVPLTDAISKGQFTAKGALLSATAASTPAVLTVGSNDQVLTADSSTATGLKWATPSSGGMTLLTTSSWSSGVVTISNIDQTYTDLMIEVYGVTFTGGVSASFAIRPNGQSSGFRGGIVKFEVTTAGADSINGQFQLDAGVGQVYGVGGVNNWIVYCYDYTNTNSNRNFFVNGMYKKTSTDRATICGAVGYESTSALTSIEWNIGGGNTANGGTVKVWGIK